MKKVIFTLAIAGFVASFTSCSEKPVDQAVLDSKINELADAKIKEATAKATEDCEMRMATELKSATDSLVHAKQMEAAAQ